MWLDHKINDIQVRIPNIGQKLDGIMTKPKCAPQQGAGS